MGKVLNKTTITLKKVHGGENEEKFSSDYWRLNSNVQRELESFQG